MRQQVSATAEQNSPATIPTCSFYMRAVLKTCDARFRNPSSLSTSCNCHRQASIVSIQKLPHAWALACRDPASPGEHRSPTIPWRANGLGAFGLVWPLELARPSAEAHPKPAGLPAPCSLAHRAVQPADPASPAWAQAQGRPS
jgi:hypothetical protein